MFCTVRARERERGRVKKNSEDEPNFSEKQNFLIALNQSGRLIFVCVIFYNLFQTGYFVLRLSSFDKCKRKSAMLDNI